MIKFFRKKRQSLASKSKFSKYLIYVLGEIALIVVGILIALQINNRNERKKANLLGKEMVLEIKSGLESDLKELDAFISTQQKVYRSQIVVSDWIKNNKPYHDSLSVHFALLYVGIDFSVNNAGYETLKKFGLRRIDNDSLRLSISNLYEIKYPTFNKFTAIYQKFLDELLSNNNKHFNELNYMNLNMKPLNISKLKADSKYLYDLKTLKNFNRLLIYQSKVLSLDINKTYAKFQ